MRSRVIATALLTWVWAGAAVAQDKLSDATPQEKTTATVAAAQQPGGPTSLRVTVAISRFQADKKISSLPYTFGLTSGERTNLRMGSDVPIISRAPKSSDTAAQPSVSYRPVGTNIDCSADRGANGLYRLMLTIEDSSVHLDPGQKSGPISPAMLNDYPSFRTFRLNFVSLLRDGQTTQHTSATDPVTGEVMRVDVTLNVVK